MAAVCIAMRLAAIPTLSTPRQDDVISYEAATGHLRDYARVLDGRILEPPTTPFGAWATAGDWKRLWTLDDRFCFRRIASGLGRHDIHPPLYFWLLHLGLLVTGVSAHAGAILNLPLAALTLLLVYGLGLEVSRSRAAAAASALLWGVSPAALYTSQLARQYELFALLTVACVGSTLRSSDPERAPTAPSLALLWLTITAGLLTHYHFALVVVAAILAALWRLRDTPTRRRIALVTVAGAGVVSALAVHPHLLSAVRRAQAMGPPFEWTSIPTRAQRTLGELVRLGGRSRATEAIWLIALGAAAVSLVLLVRRCSRARSTVTAREPVRFVTTVAALVWCAMAGLYLSFASPVHAMGPRYLSPVWPLLTVSVVSLLWPHRAGRALAAVACGAMLVAGSSGWLHRRAHPRGVPVVAASESMLLDSAARDVLPRRLWHVSPATRVFAASQEHLLAHEQDWLPTLGEQAVYVASLEHGSRRQRDRVLALLATRYLVTPDARRGPREQWFRLRAQAPRSAAAAVKDETAQEPLERTTSARAGD